MEREQLISNWNLAGVTIWCLPLQIFSNLNDNIIVPITTLLRAQERPATLILTVTSGLRFTRARRVNN